MNDALPLSPIDWSQPWLSPYREQGRAITAAIAGGLSVAEALQAALSRRAPIELAAGPLRFVSADRLPAGEPYEGFIARTGCVPTRDNLHDLFNGLVWLAHPSAKRRLNELHADQIARSGVGAARGALRDALTLFDENAALLHAPVAFIDMLRRRDWVALFVTQRAAWAEARLTLFGHALMEKLTHPRKAITAHVWVLASPLDKGDALAQMLTPRALVAKPFLPLPVLGVPGWWAENEKADFYRDADVFRPARAQKKTAAAKPLS